jgi:hypothetical protein
MSKEMVEVACKIREILMEMSDNLHYLKDMYGEYLAGIDHLMIVLDQSLLAIPNVKAFKAGLNYAIKAGINGGNNIEMAIMGLVVEEN